MVVQITPMLAVMWYKRHTLVSLRSASGSLSVFLGSLDSF